LRGHRNEDLVAFGITAHRERQAEAHPRVGVTDQARAQVRLGWPA
jgi:hypothetical protein